MIAVELFPIMFVSLLNNLLYKKNLCSVAHTWLIVPIIWTCVLRDV